MELENIKKMIANLDKLRKCRTLSPEDLKGRYHKAFLNLKHELKNQADEYVKFIALDKIKFIKTDVADDINKFIASPVGKSLMKEAGDAVYKEMSFDKLHNVALKVREQIKQIAWEHAEPDWETIEFDKPVWETERWKEIINTSEE